VVGGGDLTRIRGTDVQGWAEVARPVECHADVEAFSFRLGGDLTEKRTRSVDRGDRERTGSE
jgi:hypothetical protein